MSVLNSAVDSFSNARSRLLKALRQFHWRWFFRAVAVVLLMLPVVLMACLIVAVVALTPVLELPIYKSFVFRPLKYPIGYYDRLTLGGIKPSDHYFSVNGSKLHGILYTVPDSPYVFFLSHGNGGNLTGRIDIIEKLLATHNSVFAYDYEGYGRSQGEPSLKGICDDARGAYNYLTTDLHYPWRHVILFGESLGTIATSDLARQVPYAGVILQCPMHSLRQRACELVPVLSIYPPCLWTARGFDNSAVFAGKHPPLLIIAGTKDVNVPINHADALFAEASQPKLYARISGGGHTGDTFLMNSPLYTNALRELLAQINNANMQTSH
jgi:pimeloyl-ACP methyl ester carboxylesterase